MSKPLELTWYEQDETGDYIHPARYVISSIDVDYWIECKRLTDAELAAEYWAPTWLTMPDADWDGDYAGTALKMKGRTEVLRRLATLPDYDEVA